MNNYKLVIQYDGARYKGWQRLGNQENTIQGKIELVLTKLEGKEIEIVGSSRTDAGVHAYGQIANVKLSKLFSTEELQHYVNQYLPHDISVVEVEKVDDRFHARYHAKDKTYLYQIWNKSYTNPFLRKFSMHVNDRLNLEEMKKASTSFLGNHDFTAFSNAKSKKKSMKRTIRSIDIDDMEGLISIRIIGDGFLYHMVRKMVGTLIEVGLGEKQAREVANILQTKDRSRAGFAEAQGLHLEEIEF
ncbi:tRNA pseudouridine(38-40) synthase TruA [Halalkalibacter sp. APA_J-10(15)]|uniref:tRNA pseudouridine(38-40) synthase TruA n=1 Tax=Halalkalibacter sp. APA_J-10(15) TaxID=2933805 RepID=UPI001FF3AB6E|nr:tRNA pseudouridine(38-40) synthase TruA [Halalkalibacter sp. APA_J-10(15)]MCK0472397.1 tRNA pseudouridine(38-40) synthase TruA [Halalkalibacter sp. APA_J-10(15)]